MEDDPREPALFDLVLVYLRDSDTSYVSAAALAEQRAPRRAALVKRLRGCGLRVKKTYAQDNNGSAKTLIVVGATRTRMLAAAESSAMRLRLRPEFGGGYSTFTRALAWHFETASDVGGEAGEAAAEATHDRFELSSAQRAFLIDRLISMRAADGGAGIDLGACFKRTDLEVRTHRAHVRARAHVAPSPGCRRLARAPALARACAMSRRGAHPSPRHRARCPRALAHLAPRALVALAVRSGAFCCTTRRSGWRSSCAWARAR
jgi:hypothetical protein